MNIKNDFILFRDEINYMFNMQAWERPGALFPAGVEDP